VIKIKLPQAEPPRALLEPREAFVPKQDPRIEATHIGAPGQQRAGGDRQAGSDGHEHDPNINSNLATTTTAIATNHTTTTINTDPFPHFSFPFLLSSVLLLYSRLFFEKKNDILFSSLSSFLNVSFSSSSSFLFWAYEFLSFYQINEQT
jgi:hypothetical protein